MAKSPFVVVVTHLLVAAERPEKLVVCILDIEHHLWGATPNHQESSHRVFQKERSSTKASTSFPHHTQLRKLTCLDCSSVISSDAFIAFNSISQ